MSTLIQLTQDEFIYLGPIGVGTFGTVMRAHWKTKNKDVAIKRLPTLNPEDREIQVLTSLRHKNIILFFGLVHDNNGYGIVTEIAEYGSLFDYLRKKNQLNQRLDYERVVMWALDIARGMEYLHFQAPQTVIHRDLKSKNVVINSKLTCKLCDFGSSKFQQNSLKEASTIAGTMAWMAPEVIKESLVTEASDTYSFAIVFWELLTCKIPYHSLENLQVAWLVAMKGERPHLPAECPHKFKVLIQTCWKEDPKERPNFQFLVKNLDNLKLDKDLEEKTAVFLENPCKWQVDIGDKNDKLMKQGNELTDKEKQLQIWERQLMIKEKKLCQKEQRQQSRTTYHSLEKWTPRQVYQWVRELRKGDGDELEDQFIELANRFYAESIDGKALKLLQEDDLIKMKITGLGQRIGLLDAIKDLRESNQSLMNFPPLASTLIEAIPPPPVHQQTLRLAELVLIFGSICRPNPDIPYENRWKMFLELDGDESAIPTVQSIEFTLNEKNMNILLNRPPFIMNKWILADTPGMVECKVTFDDLIVVTPVEVNHLFTPEIGGDPIELKVDLRIKSTSTTVPTPHNSLPSSDHPSNPLKSVSSLSNQFEFSSTDMPRNSTSTDFTGPALQGDWANKGPGSLARMISSQTCPKTIVRAGPVPNFPSSNSLHPSSSLRSQSSLSHISPRLSHSGSTSRPTSPSNSAVFQFTSPRTPASSNPPFRGSYSNSYRAVSPSVTPRDYNKRLSLPGKSIAQSPGPKSHSRAITPSNRNNIIENTEKHTIRVENNHDDNRSTSSKEDYSLYGDGPAREMYNGRSSDTSSMDERCYPRVEDTPRRYRRGSQDMDRREHYSYRDRDGRSDRRDERRVYHRDQRTDSRKNQTRDYRRDNERDYRRDDNKEYRRDDNKEYRRDDNKEYRRDNEREYRRDERKNYNARKDDKSWNRYEKRGERVEEKRGDKRNVDDKKKDIEYQSGPNSEENSTSGPNKSATETSENSDSEWIVVAKNKAKTKSNYY